jgi:DNA repair protein RadC
MAALPQEHVRALLLDARARLIHVVEVYKGTVSGVNVRLAELFRPAIVAGAVQVVLVHNHPSGDPTPSEADFALTRAASAAGDALGVRVVDHVVVAHGGWASARAG